MQWTPAIASFALALAMPWTPAIASFALALAMPWTPAIASFALALAMPAGALEMPAGARAMPAGGCAGGRRAGDAGRRAGDAGGRAGDAGGRAGDAGGPVPPEQGGSVVAVPGSPCRYVARRRARRHLDQAAGSGRDVEWSVARGLGRPLSFELVRKSGGEVCGAAAGTCTTRQSSAVTATVTHNACPTCMTRHGQVRLRAMSRYACSRVPGCERRHREPVCASNPSLTRFRTSRRQVVDRRPVAARMSWKSSVGRSGENASRMRRALRRTRTGGSDVRSRPFTTREIGVPSRRS